MISESFNVVFILALIMLVKWLDWAGADLFVSGFRVTACVEESNVFRTVEHKDTDSIGELMLSADSWNLKVAMHFTFSE